MLNIDQVKATLLENGYEFIKTIGSGAYSNILLCKNIKYNQLFAVKKVERHQMSAQEYESLATLDHPNIIKLFSTFCDEDSQYLVIEYCSNGTLSERKGVDYKTFISYAKQILEALAYCHAKQIAHRDIKPENILLDQYDYLKLSDFGLSKTFNNSINSNEKCGTLIYAAPETIHHSEFCPFKADIWALGITFFVLATGQFPYKYKTREDLIDLISIGKLDYTKVTIDKRIRFLINKMTEKNYETRSTAEKLLNLPLFNNELKRKTSQLNMILPNKFLTGNGTATPQDNKIRTARSITFDEDFSNDGGNNCDLPQVRSFKTAFIQPKASKKYNKILSGQFFP